MNKECAVAPVIFQWEGWGAWMNGPFPLCDLDKPPGPGLADGKYDATFAWSCQIQVNFLTIEPIPAFRGQM